MAEKKTSTKSATSKAQAPAKKRGRPAKSAAPKAEVKPEVVEEKVAALVAEEVQAPVEAKKGRYTGYWFTVGSADKFLYLLFSFMFFLITAVCDVLYLSSVFTMNMGTDDSKLMFMTFFTMFFVPSVLTSILSAMFAALSLRSNKNWIKITSIVVICLVAVILMAILITSFVMIK